MKLVAAALALVIASAGAASARRAVPSFAHIVVIVFENKERQRIIGARDAPTFNAMARRYAQMTQYYGVAHPSLPNYLAMVSGTTEGLTATCTDCMFDTRNLADTLAPARKTWKLYAEGLPQPGYTGASAGRYAKKHAPFLYFRSVLTNTARLQRVVPVTQLRADLKGRKLPNFALIVPDLCNSMHDCPVSVGDAWLRAILPPLLKLPQTVVFVVFDEGTTNLRVGGHVTALALGTAVRPWARFTRITSHYGLLRTIEAAWGLPALGASASAAPITGIFK